MPEYILSPHLREVTFFIKISERKFKENRSNLLANEGLRSDLVGKLEEVTSLDSLSIGGKTYHFLKFADGFIYLTLDDKGYRAKLKSNEK